MHLKQNHQGRTDLHSSTIHHRMVTVHPSLRHGDGRLLPW